MSDSDYPQVIKRLPNGFRKVSVILTDREYESLVSGVALTASGTWSERIRRDLGLPGHPYGLKAALHRLHAPIND